MLGLTGHLACLRRDEFWAVNDVSFEVKRGECVGLIGPNGAGKSTLLKLINGVTLPDQGSIRISGRIGALLELGAGFHPMLTGRGKYSPERRDPGTRQRRDDEKVRFYR